MIVTLNQDEMAELFKQDASRRDGGGYQRKIVSFQERLNKTTGDLALMADDIEWLSYGSSNKGTVRRRKRHVTSTTICNHL